MKHLRYPFSNNVEQTTRKKRLALLSKQDKKHYRVRQVLIYCNLALLICLFGALIYLCFFIGHCEELSEFLRIALIIINILCIVILPTAICALLFALIDKLLPEIPLPKINKTVVYSCAAPLKKFYKIGNNFIVTKCYRSTVDGLQNKDLMLFVYNEELRIVNDFTSTVKDFGCYAFSKSELTYYYDELNGKRVTVIKCLDTVFILGKRAKQFITKNLFN